MSFYKEEVKASFAPPETVPVEDPDFLEELSERLGGKDSAFVSKLTEDAIVSINTRLKKLRCCTKKALINVITQLLNVAESADEEAVKTVGKSNSYKIKCQENVALRNSLSKKDKDLSKNRSYLMFFVWMSFVLGGCLAVSLIKVFSS